MDAGTLKDRITIQRFVKEDNDWVEHCKLWAGIRPLFAKEKVDRFDVGQSATHIFTIRLNNTINSTMRVLFNNRIYDIQQILPHFQKRDRMEMTCEELPPLIDRIAIKRQERAKGERNQVVLTEVPVREVQACIIDFQMNHTRSESDAIEWEYKGTLHFQLGEDIIKGDTITLPGHGDFFVAETDPGKHFLSVTALQERRGAE